MLRLEIPFAYLVHDSRLLFDGINGEVGRTNLLRDTPSLAFLDISLTDLREYKRRLGHNGKRTNLIQNFRLSSINMAKNTTDGTAEIIFITRGKGSFVRFRAPLSSLSLSLSSHLLSLTEFLIRAILVRVLL